eukprot:1160114-Pelagomonas_calceolata.AAC.17
MSGGLPEDVLAAVQTALRARRGDQPSEAGLLLLLDAFLLTAARQWRRQHPTAGTQPAQRGACLALLGGLDAHDMCCASTPRQARSLNWEGYACVAVAERARV